MITEHLVIPADHVWVEVIDQILHYILFDLLDVFGTGHRDSSFKSALGAARVLTSFLNHHSIQVLRSIALVLAQLGAGGLMFLLKIAGWNFIGYKVVLGYSLESGSRINVAAGLFLQAEPLHRLYFALFADGLWRGYQGLPVFAGVEYGLGHLSESYCLLYSLWFKLGYIRNVVCGEGTWWAVRIRPHLAILPPLIVLKPRMVQKFEDCDSFPLVLFQKQFKGIQALETYIWKPLYFSSIRLLKFILKCFCWLQLELTWRSILDLNILHLNLDWRFHHSNLLWLFRLGRELIIIRKFVLFFNLWPQNADSLRLYWFRD